jgi:peroxiredoxin/thiol-disulfide isomerase/thioredoxin
MKPSLHFSLRRLTGVALAASVLFSSAAAQDHTKAPNATKGTDYESQLPSDATRMKIGDRAPDFRLLGIDGKYYTLADFKAPILVVVFLSNHCPVSHAAETRLLPMVREFMARGVDVVAINPNSNQGLGIHELGYTKYTDSYEDMKRYAKDNDFPFPYVYDGDTQAVSKKYGVLATPHAYVFDRERRLQYWGQIDDSRYETPSTVKQHSLRNALTEMVAGKPVSVPVTKVFGCATKWQTKNDLVAEFDAKWKAAPVGLENIDTSGVVELVKNSSNRLRLINVWATWCAPCVAEFPLLVNLSRRLSTRKFELITISMDEPRMFAQAKKFLEGQYAHPSDALAATLKKEGRTAVNFLYTGSDPEVLGKALDPEWPGPLPHTVLVAPGGKILWRHNGVIDHDQVLEVILKELGPFYTLE